MDTKISLIWHQSPSAALLQNWKANPAIRSFTQLADFEKQIEASDILLILLEANQEGYPLGDIWGWNYLKYLRLKLALKNPIIIVSFLPLSWLIQKDALAESVFQSVGHYYLELPLDFRQIDGHNYRGLDDLSYLDVKEHLFDGRGRVDEIFHQLKNEIVELGQDKGSEAFLAAMALLIEQSFTQIKFRLGKKTKASLDEIQKQMIDRIVRFVRENETTNGVTRILSNSVGKIKEMIAIEQEETEIQNEVEASYPWQIIYLEDNSNIGTLVQAQLNKRNINCHLANSGEKVKQLLKADVFNQIVVLVCDYRLLDDKGHWQKMQGYQVIEEVYLNSLHFISFFVLSSFNDRALLHLNEKYPIRVWSFSKDDVLSSEGGFNIFSHKIILEGEAKYLEIASLPKSKVWASGYDKKFDKPFSQYYRMHRMSRDFEASSQKIAALAFDFVYEIACQKYNVKTGVVLPIYPFQEGIGKDKQFLTETEKMKKFRVKLMGRLIAIGLHQFLDLEKGRVYSTMKLGRLGRNDPSSAVNQFFTTYIGLSLEKHIPNYLLPEERNWLVLTKERILQKIENDR
ncbi:MAG: hypothetical protein AAF985_23265 [Bacteroidota bacterium]